MRTDTDGSRMINVGSCAHYRRVEVVVASLGAPRPNSPSEHHARRCWLPSGSRGYSIPLSTTINPSSTVGYVHRLRSEPRRVHFAAALAGLSYLSYIHTYIPPPPLVCMAPCGSRGSKGHRSHVVGAWSGEAKRLHSSPPTRTLLCAAPTGNDSRGGAPYTHLACLQ